MSWAAQSWTQRPPRPRRLGARHLLNPTPLRRPQRSGARTEGSWLSEESRDPGQPRRANKKKKKILKHLQILPLPSGNTREAKRKNERGVSGGRRH